MTKSSLIASCIMMATIVTLSGCGTTTDTDSGTTGTGMFAVASCNSYVDIATCMIKGTPAASQAGAQEMLDRTLVEWKKLTPEQLKTNCDVVMEVMTKNKESIEQMGCEVK